MIVVDASAILAILFNEPESDQFYELLLSAGGARMSPINHWEVLVRAEAKQGLVVRQEAEVLMADLGIEVIPISVATSRFMFPPAKFPTFIAKTEPAVKHIQTVRKDSEAQLRFPSCIEQECPNSRSFAGRVAACG